MDGSATRTGASGASDTATLVSLLDVDSRLRSLSPAPLPPAIIRLGVVDPRVLVWKCSGGHEEAIPDAIWFKGEESDGNNGPEGVDDDAEEEAFVGGR